MTLRRLAAAAFVLVVASALAGCVPNTTHSTADWLKGRAGVASVTETKAGYNEGYHGGVRVELDPSASDATIVALVDDTSSYVAQHGDARVSVSFGEHGVDFSVFDDDVSTASAGEAAFRLWKGVVADPDVVVALVGDTSLRVRSTRTPALAIFQAMQKLHADVTVSTYASAADLAGDPTGAFLASLDLVGAADCVPQQAVLDLAGSALTDSKLEFGTLDLCAGFDVTYPAGFALSDVATRLRASLDSAGLSAFPVVISAPDAGSGDGSDFHRAVVTPGDAAALGILAVFDTAGHPSFDYQLDKDRRLTVTTISSGAPTSVVLALLAGSPIAATLPFISVDDGKVGGSGTLGELQPRIDAATALLAAAPQFSSVELGSTTGDLYLADTGDQVNVPDYTAAAAALITSGLAPTRDLTVHYRDALAHVLQGVPQPFTPTGIANVDQVLQAFLDKLPAAG